MCLFAQAGAKVNMSAGGATPLHIAADAGSSEIIKCLLKAGADPNVTDEVRLWLHFERVFSFNIFACLSVYLCISY